MIQIITLLLISTLAAIWLADNLSAALPEIHTVLDCRPFNCRPCLSFHLTWILNALCASLIESFTLLLLGIALAFVVFLIMKYIDNKMIEK